jgi:autotransporter-associated beta strand protein
MKSSCNPFVRPSLILAATLAFGPAAHAATGTWSGSTTGTWDTSSTNWTGVTGTPWDVTNGTSNTSTFNLASLAATVSGTVYTNGITFSTTGSLTGGTINLAGTTPGISVAASQIGTIGSTISGSAGLTKTSAGTLIVSGSNNYTGGTAINAGTVQVNSGGTLGSTSGALSMGTGSAGTIGTVGNLTVNTNTQVGAFSVVSNTSNTTTASNIGQLFIASGSTLTVSSLAMGLASATSNNTNTALATGAANTGGTLTVSGDVTIGAQGSGGVGSQVLNLSGLTNFNAGSGASNVFRVGYGAVNASTVTLASTANVINVGTLSVGETFNNGNSSQNPALNLGVGTNALQANTIQIGTQKASGVLQFSHASNGSVVITGAGGTGVSNIFVGNQNGSGGYQSASLNNKLLLAGHTATVSAGTVNVARRTGTGTGNAVISEVTFDTGTFTTTGHVTLAQITGVAAGNGVTGTFTLGTTSANTGSLTVGTSSTPRDFILADNRMITNNFAANGSFIINGGTATIHGNILDTSTTTTGTSTTTLTLDGGTLDMTNGNIGGDGSSGNRAITNLNFRSGTLKNVAQINNGAGLTKTTAGTLLLSGTNAYTGTTLINEGILQVSGGSAIANAGLVSLADVAGVTFQVVGSETIGALSGGGTTGGKLSLDSGQTLTLSSGTQNFAGLIEGSGGITISGATQTLSGNNSSYAGAVTLSGGTLNIGHVNALGTGSFTNSINTITLANTSGAGITLSNSSYSINSSLIFGGSSNANNINTGSGDMTLGVSEKILSVNGGVTVTVGGAVSGILRKDGSGTLVLGGTSTALTSIRVTTGSLQLTGSTAATTALIMGHQTNSNVGKFILGGTGGAVNQTFGSLKTEGGAQASQSIVGGNASVSTLTIDQSTDTTYAGVLGGAGTNDNNLGLTKTGSGKLTFSGTNTYTGATSLNAGKLVVGVSGTGSIASNTTVGAGTLTATPVATLGGNGTISGDVMLTAESSSGFKNGGVLAPTASASGTKLSVTGTTNFGDGSIFQWDMAASDPATDPGNGAGNSGSYGQLAGTGAISGSNAVFMIVLGSGNAFTDTFWNTDKTWNNVFSGDGATTSLTSIFASIGGAGITYNPELGRGDVDTRGYFTLNGTSTLNWTAVPEPTTALAGLLLTAGLLRRRRG